MVKYLVGHASVLQSIIVKVAKVSGLDRNEWEALRERNLHDDLNSMFTSFWQDTAQKGSEEEAPGANLHLEIRRDDYAEIERIRAWLATRSNKQDLLAYLTDKDPFDV